MTNLHCVDFHLVGVLSLIELEISLLFIVKSDFYEICSVTT